MKKRFSILIVLLLLTGCSFEYNVEITENTVKEDNSIFIENTNEEDIENVVNDLVNKYTGPTNSLGMYRSSIVNKNGEFGVSYKKDYTASEYNDYSLSFSHCYDLYKMIKEDNRIVIATSKEFKCFDKYEELEEVTINLTTDLEVTSSTADVVENNKYSWHINRQNYQDKEINIVLNIEEEQSAEQNKTEIDPVVLVVCVFVILAIVILILKGIGKRKNKI